MYLAWFPFLENKAYRLTFETSVLLPGLMYPMLWPNQ